MTRDAPLSEPVPIGRAIERRVEEAARLARIAERERLMTTALGFAIMKEAGMKTEQAEGIRELVVFLGMKSAPDDPPLSLRVRALLLGLSEEERVQVFNDAGFCK